MDVKFDPYVLLGLSRGASNEDIKRVYHRLAQRLHPDKNRMASAARQFQDISLAYNLLSDPIARRQIDENASKNNNQSEDLYFTLRVTPSKRTIIPLDEDQVVYMLAEIFTPLQASNVPKHEAHLNICLVLDVSNSMKGPRIDRVKVAAQKIIQDLNPQDFISVVTFNDRSTVIIPATAAEDKTALRARISMIGTAGGTEIYHGLKAGYDEIRKNISNRVVNHIILLTDGHTFGDQEACFALAKEAYEHGVTITAMGLGSDWNDEFLDALSSSTGGTSMYINSTDVVVKYLNEHVRALSNAFAERMELIVAPDPDINLEMAFKLSPNPQPIELNDGIIPLSSLQVNKPIVVLLQLQIPGRLAVGFRTLVRLVATGNILKNRQPSFQVVSDFSIDVNPTPTYDEPPPVIMDALSKLTLYRIQEKARADLEAGRIEEATRRLENLATRLYEIGESALAQQALSEAQNVAKTRAFSEAGKKTIKYETRALMGQGGLRAALSSLLSSGDDES